MKNRALTKRPLKGNTTVNISRLDPTQTTTLRRNAVNELRRRFARLKGQVFKLIVSDDTLGLRGYDPLLVNYSPDQPREPDGKFGSGMGTAVVEKLKSLGHAAGHIEHVAKEYVTDKISQGVAKLPPRGQAVVRGLFTAGKLGTKAAFASWIAASALAEKVAQERGSTPEQARRLRGVLSTIDITAMKPIQIGLAATGLGALALPASFVPPATASYLAYSTARNPLATIRAAYKLVGQAVGAGLARFRGGSKPAVGAPTGNSASDVIDHLANALAAHDYSDWYIALLSAALTATQNVNEAVSVAGNIHAQYPSDSSEPDADDQLVVLGPEHTLQEPGIIVNSAWKFLDPSGKLASFQNWLRGQLQSLVSGANDLWQQYALAGFRKGAGRSFDDVMRSKKVQATSQEQLDFHSGTREQFLRSSFNQPVAVEKVKFLASRSMTELQGVTDAMATTMTRTLADGLTQGASPHKIASDLNKNVDTIGKPRAETIARTEIIRAHAEGQLFALEQMGIQDIGIMVEWSATNDGKVCEQCAPLQGVLFKTKEAHGMLPRHPNCRCAWLPSFGDVEGTKGSKEEAEQAVEESQGGEESVWGPAVALTTRNLSGEEYISPELLAFSQMVSNGWVTLESGQHVFIGDDGGMRPGGPNGEPIKRGNKEKDNGSTGSDRTGSTGASSTSPEGSGRLADKAGATGGKGAGQVGHDGDKSDDHEPAESLPAKLEDVNKKLDRFDKFFRDKGQHQVADWLNQLKDHVNKVGTEAALSSLAQAASTKGPNDTVQYWGVGTEEANWKSMGHFIEGYLSRNGISTVTGDTSDAKLPLISALGKPDKYVAGDFKPSSDAFKNKLEESQHLPGLEKSEDIGKLMGKPVTHLTPEVTSKLDSTYGKGQWIVKSYGDEAAAGYGIFFPQRAAKVTEEARNTIWNAGENLDKYGFKLGRSPDGTVQGIIHHSGDIYHFGTKEYNDTIHGDAKNWAERARAAADNEKGAMLPEGSFMAQPAFKAVGISDADRAAGKTWHEANEGRVHIVMRDGKAEVIPGATWLKGGSLPVVFESDDTRAMAKAAQDTINQLPAAARKGQVYAPDVMKTADGGYKVVELNAQGDFNGSGYLHDNHFTIDSYVSHLTGREPAHVSFIRKVLSAKGIVANWLIGNIFCSTGEGGGVDPSCSPSGKVEGSRGDVTKDFIKDRSPHPGSRGLPTGRISDAEDQDGVNLIKSDVADDLGISPRDVSQAESGQISKRSRDPASDRRILSAMADNSRYQTDDPVSRGLAFDSDAKAKEYIQKTVGSGWFKTREKDTDPLESFTTRGDIAEKFAMHHSTQVMGLDAKGPASAHGVVIEVEPRYMGPNAPPVVRGWPLHSDEHEFILPPNQAYSVQSVTHESVDGKSLYRIRVKHDPSSSTTTNDFCPTGAGGGVDPSCKRGGEATGDKAKFVGEKVGKDEHVHAENVEKEMADAVQGTIVPRVKGKQQATDVEKEGHGFEIKSLLKGKKKGISVHDDALLRKVNWATKPENAGKEFHTIVVDERATYKDGAYADKYSGHRIYYKRGSGRYNLSAMHKVESVEELRKLIDTPSDKLPEAAQGRLPSTKKEVARLKASAAKAHASRSKKDKDRKARIKAEKETLGGESS